MEKSAKKEAYKIVLEDLLNKNIGLLQGKYDAVNGDKHFMHGINVVMSTIAYSISAEVGGRFDCMFYENMEKSEKNTWLNIISMLSYNYKKKGNGKS